MRVDEMSGKEKLERSFAILSLVDGFEISAIQHPGGLFRITIFSNENEQIWFMTRDENFFTQDDNGDPNFMGLAWRVLNWAIGQGHVLDASYTFGDKLHDYLIDVSIDNANGVFEIPPWRAQPIWLNKILELSNETVKRTDIFE